MPQLFANAARAKLLTAISDTATTITLENGGSLFPNVDLNSGTFFKAVLQDDDGIEIVFVNYHDEPTGPNVFTVARGADNTVARAWSAGTVIGLRPVASDMKEIHDNIGLLQTSLNSTQSDISEIPSTYLRRVWSALTSYAAGSVSGSETVPINTSSNVVARLTLSNLFTWFKLQGNTWSARQVFKTAGYDAEYNLGTVSGSTNINFNNGQNQRVTIAANVAFTFTFPGVGHYQLVVVENATGGFTPTVSTTHRIVGGSSLSWNTAANAETFLNIYYNGSIVYVGASKVGA